MLSHNCRQQIGFSLMIRGSPRSRQTMIVGSLHAVVKLSKRVVLTTPETPRNDGPVSTLRNLSVPVTRSPPRPGNSADDPAPGRRRTTVRMDERPNTPLLQFTLEELISKLG